SRRPLRLSGGLDAGRHELLGRVGTAGLDRLLRVAGSGAQLARAARAMSLAAPQPLDLALIGNCRIAALLNTAGRIVWWCFPRFDSNPVFCRLLAGDEEKGFADVVLADLVHASSSYRRNTPIVDTELEDKHGARVRITDFAPRFLRYERIFRPPQLVRR